jgi:organic radical activating enzyme
VLVQARRGERLRVVADQVTAPTWARDVTVALGRLLPRLLRGEAPAAVYHMTNAGACSWYEFARAALEAARRSSGPRARPARARPPSTLPGLKDLRYGTAQGFAGGALMLGGLVPLKAHQYAAFALQNWWVLTAPEPVRNYLAYRLAPHRERVDHARAGPVFMTYSLTRRCNLQCRFCIVGDVLNKRGVRADDATLDDTRRIFSHPVARRCLYVMLTGGEPLLNADIVPICRWIKAARHIVSVNTNGLLLPRLLDALVATRIDMLNVSHYDENAEALDEILPLAAARIYTKLLKVIGEDAVREPERLEAVLELGRRSGCPRVFFQNTYPHVDGLASVRTLPAPPERHGTEKHPVTDKTAGYARVREELTRRYTDVRIDWPAPVITGPLPRKTCRMPWYLFAVDGKGRLALCSSHASCTGASIFDLPAVDVLNTEPWITVRRGLLDANAPAPALCRGCYTLTDRWRADM